MCIKWFKAQYPNEIIFSIPNGAYLAGANVGQRVRQWQRLQSEGALQGVPDLFIAKASTNPDEFYNGIFIEMKSQTGRLSEEQSRLHTKLKSKGYTVHVINSFEKFVEVVKYYMG